MKIPYWQLLIGPWLSYAAGFICNALVMGVNGSQMPVQLPPGITIDPSDVVHSAMTSATHLKFLADWIVINGQGIASPGDFLLWAFQLSVFPALVAWITLILKESN